VFTTDPATTTALTTHISSDEVSTSALVRVSNDIFGDGVYLYQTTDYCSVYVPRDTQLVVVTHFETDTLSPDCQQRFDLAQWNSSQNSFQLCKSVIANPHRPTDRHNPTRQYIGYD